MGVLVIHAATSDRSFRSEETLSVPAENQSGGEQWLPQDGRGTKIKCWGRVVKGGMQRLSTGIDELEVCTGLQPAYRGGTLRVLRSSHLLAEDTQRLAI